MKISRIISVFMSVCLIIGMVSGCTVVDNTYVAEVNGEKITKSEFAVYFVQTQNTMLQQAGVTGGDEIPNFWKTTEIEGRNALDVAKSQAMEDAIEIRVVNQKAKELGITLNADQLSEIESQIGNEITQYGHKDIFEKELEKMGTNMESYREWVKSIYLANSVATHLLADESFIATEEETIESIKNTYVKAKHILISTIDSTTNEPLTGIALNSAKEKANDILKRAKAGEDFDKLMNEYSEDPGLAANPEGYEFGKGQMVPEFESATYALKEGEISDLVATDYGYHIIKRIPFELTQEKIDELLISEQNTLTTNKVTEEIGKWVAEADVKIQEKVVAKLDAYMVK